MPPEFFGFLITYGPVWAFALLVAGDSGLAVSADHPRAAAETALTRRTGNPIYTSNRIV